jgi:hypothetical protein
MKIYLLSIVARLLGIQFSIDGLPYGAKVSRKAGVSGNVG